MCVLYTDVNTGEQGPLCPKFVSSRMALNSEHQCCDKIKASSEVCGFVFLVLF